LLVKGIFKSIVVFIEVCYNYGILIL